MPGMDEPYKGWSAILMEQLARHPRTQPPAYQGYAAVLDKGTSFGTPNPYEVEMVELIVSFFPSIQKVRMRSGTEATMSAIRLARGFTM